MTGWFVGVLRHHPEVAFFVTIGLGYLLGRLKLGGFTLGAVTGTLLAGVLVGQLGVTVSADAKQCFFLLFLFSIGYRCGPQFFQGLRRDGLAQAAVAAVVATTGLLVAFVVSRVFGYDAGTGAGVIAGSLTESATIGTAGDAISRLPLDAAARSALANNIPVAFAVTYLVGVVGAAWFLAQIAPRLLRIDLAQACREYEEKLGGLAKASQPGMVETYRALEVRGFRVPDGNALVGHDLAADFRASRLFVVRLRRAGTLRDTTEDFALEAGDEVAVCGPRRALVEELEPRLPELDDPALLGGQAEVLDVLLTSREVAGRTLRELGETPGARGIYVRRVMRNRVEVPLLPETTVQRGDILRLVGSVAQVEAAAKRLGRADRPGDTTDMAFVASGIVAGALVGVPSLALGGIDVGLSLSVGVLLGGLVWGWINATWPLVGRMPGATLWIFESLGLTGFVAVVGLAAGPDFVRGLQTSGPTLLLAGLFTVLLPHFVGVMVGHHVFRMHPGILLGVCAGAGTATPALAAIQEAARSPVPTLGYGVSYAVGNVLLALWGTVIVTLLG